MSNALPVLYHGTKGSRVPAILAQGFKRAGRASYTGTSTNLSETMSVCWEYGDRFVRGAILRVRLRAETAFAEAEKIRELSHGKPGLRPYDQVLQESGLDALKSFGGNVWLIWNPECVQSIERLDRYEALKLLADQIISEGDDVGYNADCDDYASVIRGESPRQQGDWFLDHVRKCAKRLAKVMDLPAHWKSRGITPAFEYFRAMHPAT